MSESRNNSVWIFALDAKDARPAMDWVAGLPGGQLPQRLVSRFDAMGAALSAAKPGTIVVGEVPLTFVPQGITTVDAIPCRESRYKIFLSEQPYVFPAEPFLVTTTPEYPLSLQVSGMRFVRITAELGRWQ